MESHDLCSDVIFEILTRTPLESLDRFKLVCKDWNDMFTKDWSFIHLHGQRTRSTSGYFLQSMRSNKYLSKYVSVHCDNNSSKLSMDFLTRDTRIEATTKMGILCCVRYTHKNQRYYVCKPSTGQMRALPNPRTKYFTDKVAMVVLQSNPLRYKIFRLSRPKYLSSTEHYNYYCEMFDSKICSWKKLEDILLPMLVFLTNDSSVAVQGTIHWLTSDNQVISLHEAQETQTFFPLPKPVCENERYTYKKLVEYKGKLALSCIAPEGFHELWVMEDYTNKEWTKRRVLNLETLGRKEPYQSPDLAAFYNSDTAFLTSYDEVILYRILDCSYDVIKVKELNHRSEIFPFQSDSEPIDF